MLTSRSSRLGFSSEAQAHGLEAPASGSAEDARVALAVHTALRAAIGSSPLPIGVISALMCKSGEVQPCFFD